MITLFVSTLKIAIISLYVLWVGHLLFIGFNLLGNGKMETIDFLKLFFKLPIVVLLITIIIF